MTTEVQLAAQGEEEEQRAVGGVKAVFGGVGVRASGGKQRVAGAQSVANAPETAITPLALWGSSYFTRSIGGLMAVALIAGGAAGHAGAACAGSVVGGASGSVAVQCAAATQGDWAAPVGES